MEYYKDFDITELVEKDKFIEDLPDGGYYFSDYWGKYFVSVKHHKRHGLVRQYFHNGKIKRVTNYKNGKKHGSEILYNTKGMKTVEKYYNNDLLFYEIHFPKQEKKRLEQIKQLERVLIELNKVKMHGE